MMKEQINENEVTRFNAISLILTILLIITIVSAPFLVYFFKWVGLAIFIGLGLLTTLFGLEADKLKKKNDVSTYKEIVSFMNGKTLDNMSKVQEKAKRPYQKGLMILFVSIATFLFTYAVIFLLEKFF